MSMVFSLFLAQTGWQENFLDMDEKYNVTGDSQWKSLLIALLILLLFAVIAGYFLKRSAKRSNKNHELLEDLFKTKDKLQEFQNKLNDKRN